MTRLEELKAVWKAADAAYYAAKDDADAAWDAYYTELNKQEPKR